MVRLTQVVDKSQLISIQTRLTESLGMSVVFEEPNGGLLNVIGQRGGVCDACTRFINRKDTGEKNCILSDSFYADQARTKLQRSLPGEVVVQFYVCNGRLRNFVIPISIGGEVLGNVFCGQFLVSPLKRDSPDFHELIKKMQELHVTRDFVLSYARLPDESEIPQIAKDNNIPPEEFDEFKKVYINTFQKAKPLKDVINAVYLLNEIAKTISFMGNAYYYSNTYVKLMSRIPNEIKTEIIEKLESIGSFVQKIKAQPTGDFSSEISKANELIYDVLIYLTKYELEYINKLLLPYSQRVLKFSTPILILYKKMLIGEAIYHSRILRSLLNKALRDKALNPSIFSNDDQKLLEKSDSDLANIESLLTSTEKALSLNIKDLRDVIDKAIDIKRKLVDKALIFESETHGLDDIEALMEHFIDLQEIRISLSSERVLSELPSSIAELRHELNLRYDIVYFNWGGISPSTNYVMDTLRSWESKIDRLGPISLQSESIFETPDISQNVLSSVRETISQLIGCKPGEVILTRNTTHGIYLVLQALDFPPKGSKEIAWIILTNCEHDTIRYCIRQLEKRFNVQHETIDLSDGSNSKSIAEDIISRCANKKVKIVILSHVTYNTGQVLDIAGIINEVKKVLGEKSPLFLIDGAQAVGHIPVDVNALGCDFYAADAHKWLYGPRGSGFLFVKESYLDKHHDSFDFLENYMVETNFRPVDETTKRIFEPATLKVETYIGMREAIKKFLEIQNVNYERIKLLSKKFRDIIQKELGAFDVHLSNADSNSGIVGIMFRSHRDIKFYQELRKKLNESFYVLVRVIENPPSLRFCISSLNSEWEISYAVSALKRLLSEMISPVKKPKVEKPPELSLIKQKTIEKIKEYTAEAMAVLTTRLKEAERRYSDLSMVMRSRELYRQAVEQLESKKKEFLECAEGITSEKDSQEIEKKLIVEFNKILYGEKIK